MEKQNNTYEDIDEYWIFYEDRYKQEKIIKCNKKDCSKINICEVFNNFYIKLKLDTNLLNNGYSMLNFKEKIEYEKFVVVTNSGNKNEIILKNKKRKKNLVESILKEFYLDDIDRVVLYYTINKRHYTMSITRRERNRIKF